MPRYTPRRGDSRSSPYRHFARGGGIFVGEWRVASEWRPWLGVASGEWLQMTRARPSRFSQPLPDSARARWLSELDSSGPSGCSPITRSRYSGVWPWISPARLMRPGSGHSAARRSCERSGCRVLGPSGTSDPDVCRRA